MKRRIFLAVSLFAVFVGVTPAQSAIEQSIIRARDQFSDIKNRSIELERIERESKKPRAHDDYTIRFPEIKEDFEQIQILNSNIFEQRTKNIPANYDDLVKMANEINHRANRLKGNLFSLKQDEKSNAKKNILLTEPQDIKKLITALDKSIDKFVHNSIFQNINIVNLQDSLAAQEDLESIIKISFSIREKAKLAVNEDFGK